MLKIRIRFFLLEFRFIFLFDRARYIAYIQKTCASMFDCVLCFHALLFFLFVFIFHLLFLLLFLSFASISFFFLLHCCCCWWCWIVNFSCFCEKSSCKKGLYVCFDLFSQTILICMYCARYRDPLFDTYIYRVKRIFHGFTNWD